MSHIVDDIQVVVDMVRVGFTFDETFDKYSKGQLYFMYGHRSEINRRLAVKSKGQKTKFEKFPLIALRADMESDEDGGLSNYKLNVAIFTATDRNLNAEERTTQIFKPVLLPLYESFLLNLRKSGLFVWKGHYRPKHTKVERPFWGTPSEEGTVKQIFDDPVDCIELIGLELTKRNCN